jgi:hypothetical protein
MLTARSAYSLDLEDGDIPFLQNISRLQILNEAPDL